MKAAQMSFKNRAAGNAGVAVEVGGAGDGGVDAGVDARGVGLEVEVAHAVPENEITGELFSSGNEVHVRQHLIRISTFRG